MLNLISAQVITDQKWDVHANAEALKNFVCAICTSEFFFGGHELTYFVQKNFLIKFKKKNEINRSLSYLMRGEKGGVRKLYREVCGWLLMNHTRLIPDYLDIAKKKIPKYSGEN